MYWEYMKGVLGVHFLMSASQSSKQYLCSNSVLHNTLLVNLFML